MMQNIQDTETVPPLNKQKMPPPTNLPKQQQPFTQQHQFGHAPPDLSPIHEIVGQPGKDISNVKMLIHCSNLKGFIFFIGRSTNHKSLF